MEVKKSVYLTLFICTTFLEHNNNNKYPLVAITIKIEVAVLMVLPIIH